MNRWESLFPSTPTHDEMAVEAAERVAEARRSAQEPDVKPYAEVGGRRARRAGLVRTKGGPPQLDVGMSRRERVRAFRQPTPAEAKRTAGLLPSAREVFAVRPRRQVDGVMTTVPWPALEPGTDVPAWMHARLNAAGLR